MTVEGVVSPRCTAGIPLTYVLPNNGTGWPIPHCSKPNVPPEKTTREPQHHSHFLGNASKFSTPHRGGSKHRLQHRLDHPTQACVGGVSFVPLPVENFPPSMLTMPTGPFSNNTCRIFCYEARAAAMTYVRPGILATYEGVDEHSDEERQLDVCHDLHPLGYRTRYHCGRRRCTSTARDREKEPV